MLIRNQPAIEFLSHQKTRRMAALRALAATMATVAALLHVAMAGGTAHTVGAPEGAWDLITDLQAWSQTQTFAPGDTLVFTYASSHDVVEVSKADYDACSAANPIATFTGGDTVINLPAAGSRYFICSVPGHCAAGMKLEVDVTSPAAPPPPVLPPPPPPKTLPPPPPSKSLPPPPPKHHQAPPPSKTPSTVPPPPSGHHHYAPRHAPAPKHAPSKPPMVAPAKPPSGRRSPAPAPATTSAAHGSMEQAKVGLGFAAGVVVLLAMAV